MVITSLISFAVSFEAVPGRLGLLLTLFLMMINMNNSISTTVPYSESMCPLIIGILMCTTFLICALLEYFIKVKFGSPKYKVIAKGTISRSVKDWVLGLDKTSLAVFYLAILCLCSSFHFDNTSTDGF